MSVAQSCPTLRPHGLQPTTSSVHGILQAGILEWGAISFSRGSAQPRAWTRSPALQPIPHPLSHQGSCQSNGCHSPNSIIKGQWLLLSWPSPGTLLWAKYAVMLWQPESRQRPAKSCGSNLGAGVLRPLETTRARTWTPPESGLGHPEPEPPAEREGRGRGRRHNKCWLFSATKSWGSLSYSNG